MERLTDDFSTACMKCAGEELGCRPVFKSGKYSKRNAEIMEKCHNRAVYDRLREYEKAIEQGKMIEPKHSEWTDNWISTDEDLDGYFDGYKCMECQERSNERYPYCPHCGANMEASHA